LTRDKTVWKVFSPKKKDISMLFFDILNVVQLFPHEPQTFADLPFFRGLKLNWSHSGMMF
jgi:hypothetical protein